MYGTGISREGDLIDLASNDGIVEKSGSWFAFKGERIGQGRENAKDYLREHPDTYKEVEARVLEKYGVTKGPAAVAAAPAEAEASGEPEKRPRVKAVK
jgi:recombination protein RecA